MPELPTANTTDPEQWMSLYGHSLFRYAVRQVRATEPAEDLVQETLVAALRYRNTFRGESSERTWLFAILKHKLLDYQKLRRREMQLLDECEDDGADVPFDGKEQWKALAVRWDAQPEALLEQQEFLQVFYACVSCLPQKMRRAFQLRELEQQSTEAVCRELRISPSNLWVILHRARHRLWICLTRHWFCDLSDRLQC